MTADLDSMRASLADRVRIENSAAIIAQAIEAIITSRQALKWMQAGPSPEVISHGDPAAFQSCLEEMQRLIVQADEQVARGRASNPQARAWIAWFEAALDTEALPKQDSHRHATHDRPSWDSLWAE